ncbi:MAG TPA: hypothetical protein VGN16_09615 [Acidobacteriaceae bacterium]
MTTARPSEVAPTAAANDAGFFNAQAFELMQRVATAFSKSSLVPKEYQGNIPNCMIALSIASRCNSEPLMVMQNLVIVHGRPTWSAQYLIGTANSCGRFTALRYEFFGEKGTDDWGCRAWAIEKSTGEKLVGSDVTIGLAKKEGWYQKSGSKWQTMPQQMLMYRTGSWWVRAYAPELSLGMHTAEEVIDTLDAVKRADGSFGVDVNVVKAQLGAHDAEVEPGFLAKVKIGMANAATIADLDEYYAIVCESVDDDDDMREVTQLYNARTSELQPPTKVTR